MCTKLGAAGQHTTGAHSRLLVYSTSTVQHATCKLYRDARTCKCPQNMHNQQRSPDSSSCAAQYSTARLAAQILQLWRRKLVRHHHRSSSSTLRPHRMQLRLDHGRKSRENRAALVRNAAELSLKMHAIAMHPQRQPHEKCLFTPPQRSTVRERT